MSKLFNIIGLRHPGKVELFQFGTIDLFNADDNTLLKIYKANPKIRYLQPTAEGLKIIYPESIIKVKALDHCSNSNNITENKSTESKTKKSSRKTKKSS